MKRMGFRLTVLAVGALAISASITGNSARAWVPGANGYILYTSSEGPHGAWEGSPHIWVIRPDGTNKRRLTGGNDAWPSWSPNGRKIVFSRQTPEADETRDWRIWEMNPDGSGQHPLTGYVPGTDWSRGDNMPRFSSDGTMIAFIRTLPGSDSSTPPNAQIWVMNADGSHPHRITDVAPTHIYAVGWEPGGFGPDHQHIVFIANRLDGSCSGALSWLSCRTFYEVSSAGGAPVAFAIQAGQPNPETGGFGAWDSLDDAPGPNLAWGDATSVATPTGLLRDDVPDHYRIFFEGGLATASVTPFVGDHPSFAPDADTTGQLAYVGCVGGRDRVLDHCNYQLSVGVANAGTNQLTFDSSNHYSPSWGPTAPLVLPTRDLSLELPPQLGRPTIPVLIHCPGGITSHPCTLKIRLMMGTGGQASSSMTFTSKAGANRLVRLPLPSTAKAGTKITIQLTTTIDGHSSQSKVTSPVLKPAALSASCPTSATPIGSQVRLSGKLSDGSPAGQRVVVVATAPDGRTITIRRTTIAGGSYSATFVPDWGGLWELQVVWEGDATHPFTSSRSCAVMVPAPPPAKTQLSITCPSTSGLNSPLQIAGALNPAFGGAQITLEYSHPREGLPTEKLTTNVATSSKGEYSDGSVSPDDPGEWDITAFYDGDAANQGSTSKTCAVNVG